jgi:hypothetical protein
MAGVIPARMTARIEDDFVALWASRGAECGTIGAGDGGL